MLFRTNTVSHPDGTIRRTGNCLLESAGVCFSFALIEFVAHLLIVWYCRGSFNRGLARGKFLSFKVLEYRGENRLGVGNRLTRALSFRLHYTDTHHRPEPAGGAVTPRCYPTTPLIKPAKKDQK